MTNREVSRWSVGRRLVAVAAGVMMMSTSCSFFGDDEAASPPGGTGGGPLGAASAGIGTGSQLRVLLSQGQAQAGPTEALAVVDGTALSDAEVAAILARLPDAGTEPGDQVEFNRPAESLRPPLVGDTVDTAFPPPVAEPAERPTTAADPLEVLRAQPDGDVGIAPFLAVTFNQAMVPLATVDELAEVDIPVEISPAIEGRWRWIGARTLRFELEPGPIDRLPAATEYEVTIPAGTTAVSGAELTEPFTFRFATPAPRVASLTGVGDPMVLEPVLVAVFDQRVDPEAVLATITLRAGGTDQALRLATDDEIEADAAAARAVAAAKAGALDGRWVAFRPTVPLPAASPVTVAVGPGTPSAEGPRTTTDAAEFTGRTFDAFTLSKLTCNYGGDCTPGAPLFLEFNNPIDTTTFDPSLVTVEPTIPGLRVAPSGNQLIVTGATRGRTAYTVTVSAQLTDTFGQRLGTDASREIEVGPARPSLAAFQRQFLITDPMADRPGISVTTVNHDSVRVTAWQVGPGDRAAFQRYLEQFYSDTEPGDPSWPQVYDAEIDIDATDDAATETLVDLSDAFAATDNNQLVVRVSPTRTFDVNSEDWWANRPQVAWVQATTLGLDAIIDRGEALIWTTDLVTGAVRPGVTVELLGTGRTVTTDDDGLARVPLNQNSSDPNGQSLVATDGGDVTLVQGYWGGYQGDESRWYVFDDRGIYRPGEAVRITGWARQLTTSGDAQLRLYDGLTEVTWRAYDPMGNELGTGTTPVNPLGGFNLSLTLPEGANLGQAFVELTAPARGTPGEMIYWSHQFQIQDFRTPEFEVTARPESPAPYYTVEPATVAVDAAYFAGGPLPDAEVNWTVTTARTTYQPPSWDRFTFGIWQPWWFTGDLGFGGGRGFGGFGFPEGGGFGPECFGPGCPPGSEAEVETFAGRTDAGGSHYLQLDFDGPDVDLPTTVRAEAAVTDVNRQVWASRTDLLVHPARWYVGLRSDRPFVEQGTPIRVDTVVTDVDGAAVAGRTVEVTAGRLEWVWANGEWTEEVADSQDCTVTSEAVTPADEAPEGMRCEFATALGGQYRITAVVTDDDGHRNRSELTVWVSGGESRPSRTVEQESVTIVPDAETYAPGDTARLLVQAPFDAVSGLATVTRGGVVASWSFDVVDGSAVIEVPIEEAWIPNVTVQIDLVGTAPRLADDGTPADGAPPRPAFATGQITLRIPPVTRALEVTAAPAAAALGPGDDTAVTVTVTGPDGAPVAGADVALLVADEAVLSLTGYQLADPLDVFYAESGSYLYTEYARAAIVLNRADLVNPDAGLATGGDEATEEEAMADDGAATATTTMAAEMPASSTNGFEGAARMAAGPQSDSDDSGGGAGTGAPIVVRSDFDPVAVFAPAEATGADGTVTVAVPLPDNLTRYRVMAVAVDGADRFGKGESTITARLPLMVRPSAPRFLNFGDAFELPVVVQNQTDAAVEVDVAVDAANLTLTAGAGKRVSVPANDRVEVRFPAAAERAGTARFRVVGVTAAPAGGAAGGGAADAAAIELPVYTPATAEAFATYGVLDDGAVAQPVDAPDGVLPQFGGLEINTSSTALQALTDAVLYLYDYRYDSAEAYASRIMAVAALRDVLDAFDADGLPAPAVLNAQVQRDITRLAALQNDDGGFSHWQRGQRSVPWTSIQATHALVLARDAGYNVPGDTLERALARLADVEALFTGDELYGEQVRNTLSAYALHVRDLGGAGDPAKALALWERAGDDLELDALAWLWTALDEAGGGAGAIAGAAIERTITNRATDTAGAVTFATSYGDDAWVIAHSDRRTDGIVLDALISQRPDSDLIPKAVAGLLLGNQRRGRWDNVLENGFILVAMKRYFDTFESVTPDFVARAWLGDTYAAEHRFEGRTTDRSAALVPMTEVVAAGDTRVVVAKDGPGRLYYRLGLRYAPDDLTLAPRDEGFVVERRYVAVDDPGDVTRDADGTWRIRAGATVQVELTMVADAARTHVALIDPLPAGLEPLNPALAASPTPPPAPPADGDGGGDGGLWPLGDIGWCWCWQWYEHQNLRDDRAEAFTSYLPGGTYTYTYTARATTPGTFVVPPTRAEEMYAPETFGRSASTTVVVN